MPYKRGKLTLLDGATFTFAANTRQTSQLPVPARFMKRLWLSLRGTLTISAVTVPGTVHADGPANLISNVELLLDGYSLKNARGAHFMRLSQRYDQWSGINTGLNAAAAGAYEFHAMIPLMFAMPSSKGEFDTVEDGRFIRNMVLNLTWGGTGDLIVGNTSTLALTATTCQVYVEDTEPNFVRRGQPYRFRETDTSFLNIVTSGGTRLLIPFSQGGIMRSILFKAIDGADLSDAIINTLLSLRINGGDELPFENIEDDFFQGLAGAQFGGPPIPPEGYYLLELAEGGRDGLPLTTGLGAGAPNVINTVEAIMDTTVGTGPTSIIAHIAEMIPFDTTRARAAA